MPQIPVTSPLGYVGVSLLLFGFFLVLAGLGIVEIKQITVKPGLKTWGFGGILVTIGIGFLLPDIMGSLPQPAAPTPTVTETLTSLATSITIAPTETPLPPTNTAAPSTGTPTPNTTATSFSATSTSAAAIAATATSKAATATAKANETANQAQPQPLPHQEAPAGCTLPDGEVISAQSLAKIIGGNERYWTDQGNCVWRYWDQGNNVTFRHPGGNTILTYWEGFPLPKNSNSCIIESTIFNGGPTRTVQCTNPGAEFEADGVGFHSALITTVEQIAQRIDIARWTWVAPNQVDGPAALSPAGDGELILFHGDIKGIGAFRWRIFRSGEAICRPLGSSVAVKIWGGTGADRQTLAEQTVGLVANQQAVTDWRNLQATDWCQ